MGVAYKKPKFDLVEESEIFDRRHQKTTPKRF